MRDTDTTLSKERAQAIARLSTLERLREQARDGGRAAMLASIEKMIESELRLIGMQRGDDTVDAAAPAEP